MRYSPRISLVALGIHVCRQKILAPLHQRLKIAQKKVRYSPLDKLTDALITLLAGAQAIAEVNKRVRSDPILQAAFERDGCAEQSVIQATLDACTTANVNEMEQAMRDIFQTHSQAVRHPYQERLQLLEVDMTGRPCGKKAAFASKGYFAHQRNRQGRQEGYVVATEYEEVVVKQLFDGKTQLPKALQPLVQASEQMLGLTLEQRQRTVLRVDSGGGSEEAIHWMLERGYKGSAECGEIQRGTESIFLRTPHSKLRTALSGAYEGLLGATCPEVGRECHGLGARPTRCQSSDGLGHHTRLLRASRASHRRALSTCWIYGFDTKAGVVVLRHSMSPHLVTRRFT